MTPEDPSADPAAPPGDEAPTARTWLTVVEAAERAGIDTGTVRRWYRAGRLPTRRGDRGAFLVPLDGVTALATELMEREDAGPPAITEDSAALEVTYWAMQAEAAREEATAAREEALGAAEALRGAEEQLSFLRGQLAELSEENRNLRERVGATPRVRDDEEASASSVTDFSWLQNSRPYESPVRPQARPVPPVPSGLAGLLQDAQKDEAAEGSSPAAPGDGFDEASAAPFAPAGEGWGVGPRAEAASGEVGETGVGPVHHDYGYNEDDVLPNRKGRRRG